MKLIDLLVQELPKRGGWPKGAGFAAQDDDGSIYTFERVPEIDCGEWIDGDDSSPAFVSKIGYFNLASDQNESTVTRSEYEAALAESQKVEWDGVWMPPVGCECEYNAYDTDWKKCIVLYISDYTILLRTNRFGDPEEAFTHEDIKFRPIRSDADKKRYAAANAMCNLQEHPAGEITPDGISRGEGKLWVDVYDAIAAGKIPGVRID